MPCDFQQHDCTRATEKRQLYSGLPEIDEPSRGCRCHWSMNSSAAWVHDGAGYRPPSLWGREWKLEGRFSQVNEQHGHNQCLKEEAVVLV